MDSASSLKVRGVALEIGMLLVDGGTGAPVLLSMDVMSPVAKKSGNVCCNTYIARPVVEE